MSGCCPPGKGLPNSQAYSADAASPVPTLVPVFESSMLGVGRFWTMGAPAVPFPGGIVSLSLGFMNRNHPGQGNPWNFRHLQFPLLLRTINEPESGNYLQINDSARRMGNWSCPDVQAQDISADAVWKETSSSGKRLECTIRILFLSIWCIVR